MKKKYAVGRDGKTRDYTSLKTVISTSLATDIEKPSPENLVEYRKKQKNARNKKS
jgi:hypothetical protein